MSVPNVFDRKRYRSPLIAVCLALFMASFAAAQFGGFAGGGANEEDGGELFPNGFPRLEKFLVVAIERHPEVVVARSKVEEARAELLRAEAAALKQLLQLHQQATLKRTELGALRQRTQNKEGSGDMSRLENLASDVSLSEWEIALALGFKGSGKPNLRTARNSTDPDATNAPPQKLYVEVPYPPKAITEKFKQAFLVELEEDLEEISIADFCALISEKAKIQAVPNQSALNDAGFQNDSGQFTLQAKGASIAAVIQQFEDRYSPIRFVVRDYGILITTEDTIGDGISVRDFANLTEEEIRDKRRARLESDLEINLNGGMGMMGGGGFFQLKDED